jgi:hypothetical protein
MKTKNKILIVSTTCVLSLFAVPSEKLHIDKLQVIGLNNGVAMQDVDLGASDISLDKRRRKLSDALIGKCSFDYSYASPGAPMTRVRGVTTYFENETFAYNGTMILGDDLNEAFVFDLKTTGTWRVASEAHLLRSYVDIRSRLLEPRLPGEPGLIEHAILKGTTERLDIVAVSAKNLTFRAEDPLGKPFEYDCIKQG